MAKVRSILFSLREFKFNERFQ